MLTEMTGLIQIFAAHWAITAEDRFPKVSYEWVMWLRLRGNPFEKVAKSTDGSAACRYAQSAFPKVRCKVEMHKFGSLLFCDIFGGPSS